jgi:hypothetical protein
MTRSFCIWIVACVCAWSGACASELGDTTILLTIDSDLSVPDELDRVTVEGTGFDTDSAPSADLRVKPLPRSIALRHESGPYGPLELTVTGYHGEQRLVQRTLRTSFVPGYVSSVVVSLTRSCAHVLCGAGLTCEEGACRGVAHAMTDAPKPDAGTLASLDAGAAPADASGARADAASAIDANGVRLDASGSADASATDAAPLDAAIDAASGDAANANDAAGVMADASSLRDATAPIPIGPGATPVCSIARPSNAATLATELEIALQGSCSDHETGPLTAGLTWSSQLDGQIGTGATATARLRSPGLHLLRLCAPDPVSSSVVGCASVTVVVLSYAPVGARIHTIRQGAAEGGFVTGRAIVMQGSGAGTGMLTLRWSDSLQGSLGAGTVATLSNPVAGRHVVTLEVTDQLGSKAAANQSFTVNVAPRP